MESLSLNLDGLDGFELEFPLVFGEFRLVSILFPKAECTRASKVPESGVAEPEVFSFDNFRNCFAASFMVLKKIIKKNGHIQNFSVNLQFQVLLSYKLSQVDISAGFVCTVILYAAGTFVPKKGSSEEQFFVKFVKIYYFFILTEIDLQNCCYFRF